MTFPLYPLPSNWLQIVARYHAWGYADPATSPGSDYNFTGDISDNSETSWNNVIWLDSSTKPTYAFLSDSAFQQEALSSLGGFLAASYLFTDHAQLLADTADISTLATSVSSLSSAVGGKVPTSRTVNSHSLSSDVTVTKGDVGLGNVDNTADASKTFTASQITDMAEAVQDMASSFMQATTGLVATYNDGANTMTFTAPRTTSSLSLSLVGTGATGTQISSTKDSTIRCNLSTSTTSTIGGGATSVIALKVCATNSATEGDWTTVGLLENDQTITLALTLQSLQVMKGQLNADVPATWYAKLVNSGTGTHAEAVVSCFKTLYG